MFSVSILNDMGKGFKELRQNNEGRKMAVRNGRRRSSYASPRFGIAQASTRR
jgi:hypothetical protein